MKASGSPVTVHGLAEFDPDQPRILVANHQSSFDVFALCGWLPGNFRFVVKKELAKIPIFGAAWQRCGHVSIDRSDLSAAIESLQTVADRVASENLTIAMFAEGTRSKDGRLQPFKKGPFVLAIRAGVPIVPVAISGTHEILPKGRWRIEKSEVHVHVGSPIPTDQYSLEDRDTLRDVAFRALSDLLEVSSASETSSETPSETSQGLPANNNLTPRGEQGHSQAESEE